MQHNSSVQTLVSPTGCAWTCLCCLPSPQPRDIVQTAFDDSRVTGMRIQIIPCSSKSVGACSVNTTLMGSEAFSLQAILKAWVLSLCKASSLCSKTALSLRTRSSKFLPVLWKFVEDRALLTLREAPGEFEVRYPSPNTIESKFSQRATSCGTIHVVDQTHVLLLLPHGCRRDTCRTHRLSSASAPCKDTN